MSDTAGRAAVAKFQRLAKMIERELELAAKGRTAELLAAVEQRGRYLQTLPSPAPIEARNAVERARALHARSVIETTRLRDEIGRRRDARRRAAKVAGRYAPPAKSRYSTSA